MIHFVIMLTRVPIQDCGPKGAVSTPVDKMRRKEKPRKNRTDHGKATVLGTVTIP